MANVKISDLTEDTSPATGDWIETEDVSANTSKKVSFTNALRIAGAVVPQSLMSGTGTSWAWQSWTPTWANFTIGNGTMSCKYAQIGKTVKFRVVITLGSTSSMGSLPTFTLPVTSVATPSILLPIANGVMGAAGGSTNGFATWASTTTALLRYWDTNNNLGNVTATAPGTWTTSDVILLRGEYEAA